MDGQMPMGGDMQEMEEPGPDGGFEDMEGVQAEQVPPADGPPVEAQPPAEEAIEPAADASPAQPPPEAAAAE